MTHLLNDIGNTAIWVASAGIVIFTIQYSLLAAWWRNPIGITIVGLDLCILAIFIPTLLALADPASYAHFATTRWYLWLTVGIVVATAVFVLTRIWTWESIRRQRGKTALLPSELAARVRELEAENTALRQQLAGDG